MAIIIAASLQLQTQADEAVEQLILAGFAPDKVTSFYVNPPGQHALYPIGGDRYQSPGAVGEAGKGSVFNTTVADVTEAVIGVTHRNPDDAVNASHAAAKHAVGAATNQTNNRPPHRGGMMVAVELADLDYLDKAVGLLSRFGANNIEKAEGEIVDGEWRDFDPLSDPIYL